MSVKTYYYELKTLCIRLCGIRLAIPPWLRLSALLVVADPRSCNRLSSVDKLLLSTEGDRAPPIPGEVEGYLPPGDRDKVSLFLSIVE